MGAAESKLDSKSAPQFQGYQVLAVSGNSPANGLIEPYFDSLVGLHTDTPLQPGEDLLQAILRFEGKQVILKVWNSRLSARRDVPIVPTKSEGSPTGLLGLTLKLHSPPTRILDAWHILQIVPDSPAESAGLVPYSDYVLSWQGGPRSEATDAQLEESAFYNLIGANKDKSLSLLVWNSELEKMREVVLVPNRHWGGEGLLGCGVGWGMLHRLPE